ncbi:MAG: hypothetical protein SFX72_16660 [Isosphaeraceae bacterium]|nr:hypothetical protein [Isosphaeraceae bacterium]
MKLRRDSLALLFVVAWCASGASEAIAGPVNVGKIVIDKYDSVADKTGGVGGVDIIAHYELNAEFAKFKACFEEKNLFWLQKVDSSGETGFTPTPNRPFIDPRSDQPGGFDALPWYDATFATLADANANTNRKFGSGPFIMDTPRVLLERGPYSFKAETLLVVEKDKMIAILGGFSWGFSIAADDMTVTKHPIAAIGDLAAAKTSFNTALAKDFPGYEIKDFEKIWPEVLRQGTPTVSLVPEPSTWVLGIASVAGLAPIARRRRAA